MSPRLHQLSNRGIVFIHSRDHIPLTLVLLVDLSLVNVDIVACEPEAERHCTVPEGLRAFSQSWWPFLLC